MNIIEMKDAAESKEIQHIDVGFEIKQLDVDADPDFFIFEGLASTFGNIDLGEDIVQAGAFRESLEKELPVILWQHDRWEPIGVSIEAKEITEGLFIKGKLPRKDTFVSGRVIPQMDVGSVRKMSIGFIPVEVHLDNETGVRTLIKVILKEVSLVTFPMNPLANVTAFKCEVGQAKEIKTKRDFEKALRESGAFSREAATMLTKHFVYQGEPGEDDQGDPDEEEKALALLNEMKLDDPEMISGLKSMNRKLGELSNE